LSDAERERLSRALKAQYGREIHLNEIVDPSVIGGMRVEIGDDVFDATVSSRLDDARRKLAG
jgi:F-type H+-transporting ATPase subunit delta